MGEAEFIAASGKRTFSMSGAKFEGVPNFIQAHFDEAPRLDNVVVNGQMLATPEKSPRKARSFHGASGSIANGRTKALSTVVPRAEFRKTAICAIFPPDGEP